MSDMGPLGPDVICPLRPGEPCALCQVASDPRDCGLVYLVMNDDELREGLRRHTALRAAASAQVSTS